MIKLVGRHVRNWPKSAVPRGVQSHFALELGLSEAKRAVTYQSPCARLNRTFLITFANHSQNRKAAEIG